MLGQAQMEGIKEVNLLTYFHLLTSFVTLSKRGSKFRVVGVKREERGEKAKWTDALECFEKEHLYPRCAAL